MPRILALEWNASQASLLVANVGGSRMRVEQSLEVDLRTGSEVDGSQQGPAQRLADELKNQRLGRLPAVAILGRTNLELRHLTIPAAPDDELPDLVRFQALRQFNNLEENWPLDFIPMEGPADQDRHVLAAAVHPELLEQTQQLCETAGLKLARVVLRPCAAVSLALRRVGTLASGTRLLVNVDQSEADLAVIMDGRVSFLRQTNLSGDPLTDPAALPTLLMELRRTVAAARNQPGSRPVEACVLLGAGDRHQAVAKAIAEDLGLPTELANPYEAVDWRDAVDASLRDLSGRVAPLIGALWDEGSETAPALDFLHPRKRPEPPSRRNTYALAGLTAALIVLAVIVTGWVKGDRLRSAVRTLQTNSARLEPDVKKALKADKAAEDVNQWIAGEVNWLDELRWLSEHFSPAENAMLTGLKVNANGRRAEMTLEGVARDVQAITQLGKGLQDKTHGFDLKSSTKTDAKPPYGMQFRSSVFIGKQ